MIEKKEAKKFISKIRKIAENGKSGLTIEQKQFIAETAKVFELNFVPRGTICNDCYYDECFVIMRKYAELYEFDAKRKYNLRPGVDVIFNGKRINAATLKSDADAEKLISEGFPKRMFVDAY